MSVAISPVSAPVVTIDEAKAYLRIGGAAEDALIDELIASATALCEAFIGQMLIARGVDETIPACAAWRRLARTPVRSISGVDGLPADGASFAFAVDAYAIDIDANGDGWARVLRPGAAGRAIVHYQAGIAADASGVPQPLKQGIIRLVAHLHAHRDAGDDGGPPAAVAALWRPWRRMRLA